MLLEAGFTALDVTSDSTGQPAPGLELGSPRTSPGAPFTFYTVTPQPIYPQEQEAEVFIPERYIYSHLSSERCPAACTPPKDIPWKLQNQRQPAACCWPGNAAQRILRWASGCGVC